MRKLPTTGAEAFQRPVERGRQSSSNGAGANGTPRTTDPAEKYFEREGFEIEEIPPEELPAVSNRRSGVAFRVTDGTLDGEIKASDTIGVFTAPDATIRAGAHFRGGGGCFRFEDRAGGSEVRRFELDVRDPGKGAKWIINRGVRLRDVTVRGEQDAAPGTQWGAGIYIAGLGAGETVVLENVRQPGGASRTEGVPSHHDSIGVILEGSCDGDLRMTGCEHGKFPNNSIYASGPTKKGNDGRAVVENCTLRNSDRDQVRVGADSVVRNCTLVANKQAPGFDNLRGGWIRYSRGVTFENNTIRTYPGTDPGEAIRVDSTAASATIRNNDIELRGDHHAARGLCAYSPDEEARDAGADITVEDNSFSGTGEPRDVILIQKGRGGSTIRNNDINVPGAEDRIDFRR